MARARTILDAFVGDPRPGQAEGLLQVGEALAGNADVVVVTAPTGSGKTRMGECVARHATFKRGLGLDRALYMAPTNALVDQVLAATTGFATIRRQDMYQCIERVDDGWSCAEHKRQIGHCCQSASGSVYSHDACPYLRDLRQSRSAGRVVTTYHAAMAHDLLVPDVLVVDEAHNLIPFLRSLAETTLWRHDYGWRRRLEEPEDVIRWLSDELPAANHDASTDLLWRALTGPRPTHMLDTSPREYRGQWRDALTLVPLDVRSTAGIALRAQRIILMSATIGPLDVAALGLDRRRVAYVDIPSPIPPDQRPVEFMPVADMRFAGRAAGVREMARWIVDEYLPAWSGPRDFIHATYSVAEALREITASSDVAGRLRFHDRFDKATVLADFLEIRGESDNRVLVGSGMAEGLDLAGDLARFQLITAVPRPSIADPAVAWLAEHRPREYEWAAIRDLTQMAGRISRGPDDWGVTTIADASAARELASELLPPAMRESIAAGRRP